MKCRHFELKCWRKYISYILIAFLLWPISFVHAALVSASELQQTDSIFNEKIAQEIFLETNKNYAFPDSRGKCVMEYILTANLNEPTVKVITNKANDRVLQINNLSKQIAREQGLGKQVVAGINGDMYNISPGTIHYGAPLGLQVQNGEIIVGFETPGSTSRYPIFIIDKKGKPLISYVKMDNRLSIIDEEYEKKHGKANPTLTTSIDTINRNNTAVMYDKMFLITPKMAPNPVIGFTDDQASNGTFTILKNVKGVRNNAIMLGEEYEAEVVAVNSTAPTSLKSIALTNDMMVLASQGVKADWIRQYLKDGDKVRFSFNLRDLAGNNLEVEQAISSWLPLVENGRALSENEMLQICADEGSSSSATIRAKDKGRTAIGYTKDNKVIALVVDGVNSANKSCGTDLPSMAKRLEQLGVVAAVSLDGGGSTQMNTRLFGEEPVRVINHPSDGRERSVSNAILFLSNAPRTYGVAELKVDHDIIIFKNNHFNFKVRGVDSNSHPAVFSPEEITWSIDSSLADTNSRVNKHGLFKAGDRAEIVNVQANYDGINNSAQVRVVDTVDKLTFGDTGVIVLPLNLPKALDIKAYTEEGFPIILNNRDIEWDLAPATLATISSDGILIPLNIGEGIVTAKVEDKETSLKFIAGLENQLIEDYETNGENQYYVDGYVGGSCEVSPQQAKLGQYSLKVDYDYSNWTRVYNGSINIRLHSNANKSNYASSIRPKQLGMWVYGDGQAPWLRAVIKDSEQNSHIINLAPRINWVGWQYVSAEISPDISLPITLDYFYLVETDKNKDLRGTVYFDNIEFVYF